MAKKTAPPKPENTSNNQSPAPSRANANPANRSRLGRGLSSLMQVGPVTKDVTDGSTAPSTGDSGGKGLRVVQTAMIDPNPHQPRKRMGPAALAELAASIKTNGIIQPLVVKPAPEGRFQLIAGERRLRAAKLAELETVPVVVRDATVVEQAELALVENIQREDLNPIDRGEAYKALQEHLGMSQTELAERLGEDRSTVANHIRLLDLAEPVRELVRSGELPLGHAKVIAGVEDQAEQVRLAELAKDQKLTVRNLERLTAGSTEDEGSRNGSKEEDSRQRYLSQLAETLSQQTGTRCSVTASGRKGYRLTLHLKNADQFDRLMERLGVDLD